RAAYVDYVRDTAQLRWMDDQQKPPRIDLGSVAGLAETQSHESGDAQPASPAPRVSRSFLRQHNLAVALAVAFASVAAVIAWMAFSYLPDIAKTDGKPAAKDQDEVVAWLVNTHNVEWTEGGVPKSTRYKPGQRLAVESGLVQIQYANGANVVIEGPAEFVVGGARDDGDGLQSLGRQTGEHFAFIPPDPQNTGFLKHGKLVARVANKRAQGFTIDTPSTRVVDLGTEFGVNVARGGDTQVAVVTGVVELVRESPSGTVAERVRLTKDQGAFVAARDARIMRQDTASTRLIASVRQRLNFIEGSFDSGVIANGGFDGYANSRDDLKISQGTPFSWVTTGTGNPLIESGLRANISRPHAGKYHLIFDILDDSANPDELGGVYQTFETVAGAKYNVSFYAARANTNFEMLLGVDVFDGGNGAEGDLLDEQVVVTSRRSTTEWQRFAFDFTAASGTTTLRLADLGKVSDPGNSTGIDVAVDSVVVLKVADPDPSAEEPPQTEKR
ncbi:MAG: FecR domain-containing protein, partial [Pirellulales bacterium]|nr:FecR domain-containing protein [Pirellulales bacterium]